MPSFIRCPKLSLVSLFFRHVPYLYAVLPYESLTCCCAPRRSKGEGIFRFEALASQMKKKFAIVRANALTQILTVPHRSSPSLSSPLHGHTSESIDVHRHLYILQAKLQPLVVAAQSVGWGYIAPLPPQALKPTTIVVLGDTVRTSFWMEAFGNQRSCIVCRSHLEVLTQAVRFLG